MTKNKRRKKSKKKYCRKKRKELKRKRVKILIKNLFKKENLNIF
jgi:hypothetical protein